MCTLTYFPENGKVIMTSNRDESPLRPLAEVPKIIIEDGIKLCYPKDPLGGGSWIICRSNGYMACLLNGGFERHKHSPPYRLSRGLILKQAICSDDPMGFLSGVNLENIEPFNLVFLEQEKLFELRWDGARKHFRSYDPNSPAIWASASLYSRENINKRRSWFQEWLDGDDHSAQSLINFHTHTGDGDTENDLVMDRGGKVQTVSTTQFIRTGSNFLISYDDLLNHKQDHVIFGME